MMNEFNDMTIDIDTGVIVSLVRAYVSRMRPESQYIFNKNNPVTVEEIQTALYDAVLNETVNDALQRMMVEDIKAKPAKKKLKRK